MATLQLDQLECIHPDDAVRDEVHVRVSCDGGGITYDSGERHMREGDTQELTTADGIPFADFAVIQLVERDAMRYKSLGSVGVSHPLPDGAQTAYLPSAIRGPRATCYRLSYHVDPNEEDVARPRNRIELLSLRCDDAQGTSDRVWLYVNDRLVWGPAVMMTGHEIDLGTLSVDFRSSATVRLQETRGQDWHSDFTLRYGEDGYVINNRRSHSFAVDHGIVGDATYTLTYRLRRLPAR